MGNSLKWFHDQGRYTYVQNIVPLYVGVAVLQPAVVTPPLLMYYVNKVSYGAYIILGTCKLADINM